MIWIWIYMWGIVFEQIVRSYGHYLWEFTSHFRLLMLDEEYIIAVCWGEACTETLQKQGLNGVARSWCRPQDSHAVLLLWDLQAQENRPIHLLVMLDYTFSYCDLVIWLSRLTVHISVLQYLDNIRYDPSDLASKQNGVWMYSNLKPTSKPNIQSLRAWKISQLRVDSIQGVAMEEARTIDWDSK